MSGVTSEDFIEENVNIMKHTLFILQIFLFSIVFGQNENIEKLQFEFEVDSIELHVGETKELTIKLLNEDGDLSQNSFYVFGQRRALSVSPRTSDSTGIATVTVKAHKPGRLSLSVQSITVKRDDRVRDKLVVNVPFPPIDHLVFNQTPSKLYTKTSTLSRVSPASSITSTEKDVDVSVYSLLGVWLNTR